MKKKDENSKSAQNKQKKFWCGRWDKNIFFKVMLRTGYFNAGHIDENETALTSIVRKAKKEAGIEVHPEDVIFGCIIHRKVKDRRRA